MKSYEILSLILRAVAKHAEPGVTTLTLNNIAASLIEKYDAISYNKGYRAKWAKAPYPLETCISVNHQIAHGIPSMYKLQEGDLVNIDLGIVKDGECADAALTVGVGTISAQDAKLLQYAKKALYEAIGIIKEGTTIEMIANKIETVAGWGHFVVNRQLTGHGIGKDMHEDPHIYQARNWLINNKDQYEAYQKYLSVKLVAGQRICIEPMLTLSDRFGRKTENDWTFVTRDGKKSAMFEHMMEVTKDGVNVLTTHID